MITEPLIISPKGRITITARNGDSMVLHVADGMPPLVCEFTQEDHPDGRVAHHLHIRAATGVEQATDEVLLMERSGR